MRICDTRLQVVYSDGGHAQSVINLKDGFNDAPLDERGKMTARVFIASMFMAGAGKSAANADVRVARHRHRLWRAARSESAAATVNLNRINNGFTPA